MQTIRNTACAIGTALTLLAGAATGQTTHDVEEGGVVIEPKAGSGQIVVKLRNKLEGRIVARDVSVTVLEPTGEKAPNITGIDVVTKDAGGVVTKIEDVFDDDGDGEEDLGETDTTASKPSTTGKSMFPSDGIFEDDIAEVVIKFDKPLPENIKLRIKFSKKLGGVHADVCVPPVIGPEGMGASLCSAGPGQMAFDFINESGKAVEALTLPLADWTVRPERIFAERDDIHCVIDDDSVRIYDDPPKPRLMEPGERLGIVILFAGPLAPDQEFKFPVRADLIAGECYPDCDGDGKLDIFDFLCFQNAFAAGELQADCDGDGALDIFDFLCFQNEFGAGCP